MPTACRSSLDPHPLHHGMTMPLATSICSGDDTMYYREKKAQLAVLNVSNYEECWTYFIAERYCHDGDEETEERLQFTQSVFIQE